ncbi:MAG: hypothetical protein A2W52_03145 [Candidatus Taylorbacteria bacterium RIFCSPHIGHO2_02_49_25]|uniref:Uncharacterized protein n=1 Tax=Candidatus Taylorbacteria bacterium RIFCSPHIGHO2_02_49_25 TaxID=1802305 RepID=A0A1G2MIQ3_9BACT|nr:MAG: hypothetical protein UY62_C0011G0007 [Parcubacteria group bacterium GW2011_GWF2_50_9]OHA19845.1 MAG: hypothetical protein A2759_04300 [Candidatus Taylorbacteria bacterium RIFCSPHIGHO2_01_FULL_49_60]OHA22882.1 MAG: hypothetical protein A2W52_03145 [Candidatus Taylorbacteria bacterium RIFCSPHIGHO2_02_49_25]OHA36302.1 MAG: hypothetical protein A2W65_01415 [Candidatus Taylorbacteria bacterium RIFCSPLOWO2_02_50_13]OHA41001.1 MAG: hypothetical protein A3H73_02605 [Candidatus Taylorbacteria ba
MDISIEAISHRCFAKSGKKRLILDRSTSVLRTGAVHLSHFADEMFRVFRCPKYSHLNLSRLHRFFLESGVALDYDSFSDSF